MYFRSNIPKASFKTLVTTDSLLISYKLYSRKIQKFELKNDSSIVRMSFQFCLKFNQEKTKEFSVNFEYKLTLNKQKYSSNI